MAYISTEGASGADTANTGSVSITVPGTCKTVVVLVACYEAASNYFSGGSLTINSVTMSKVTATGDTSTSWFQGTMFYLSNPATGAQTLAWDWAGTNTSDEKPGFLLAYYTDEISGERDSEVDHHGSGSAFTTPSISAQSGDLVVAGAWGFDSGNTNSGTSFTMTNVTERGEYYGGAVVDMVIGDATASGSLTVTATHSESQEGGIIGVAFIPAAAATIAPAASFYSMLRRNN